MKLKIKNEERSWTETPQEIKEKLAGIFPNIEDLYEIGEGVVAVIDNALQEKHKQAMVFPLRDKESGCIDFIAYYPIRDNYILHPKLQYTPITTAGETFKTKRGLMTIVANGTSFAYQYSKVLSKVGI